MSSARYRAPCAIARDICAARRRYVVVARYAVMSRDAHARCRARRYAAAASRKMRAERSCRAPARVCDGVLRAAPAAQPRLFAKRHVGGVVMSQAPRRYAMAQLARDATQRVTRGREAARGSRYAAASAHMRAAATRAQRHARRQHGMARRVAAMPVYLPLPLAADYFRLLPLLAASSCLPLLLMRIDFHAFLRVHDGYATRQRYLLPATALPDAAMLLMFLPVTPFFLIFQRRALRVCRYAMMRRF